MTHCDGVAFRLTKQDPRRWLSDNAIQLMRVETGQSARFVRRRFVWRRTRTNRTGGCGPGTGVRVHAVDAVARAVGDEKKFLLKNSSIILGLFKILYIEFHLKQGNVFSSLFTIVKA